MQDFFNVSERAVRRQVKAFTRAEGLPISYVDSFIRWYFSVTFQLADLAKASPISPIVGLSGCQGSGKSTVAKLMANVLNGIYGVKAVVLSLDDFYLTKSEREAIARDIHPLFVTRGVPGTHDTALLKQTVHELRSREGPIHSPLFDKAEDERTNVEQWPRHSAPVQLILLEGWCVGVPPQGQADLTRPVNALEAEFDAGGVWREEVNRQLAGAYADLFSLVDILLVLQAPGFHAVSDWRWEQESRLSASFEQRYPDQPDPTMSYRQLSHFVLHFQRLTEHALKTLPKIADHLWDLAVDRSVCSYTNLRGLV